MGVLVWLLITVLALVVLGGIGRGRERMHLRELDERAERLSHLPLMDTAAGPSGLRPVHAELVMGNAVIGSDYLKQFLSSWRMLFGGELRSFQTILTRARKEAQTRMLEDAYEKGARAVINVRFETSQVSGSLAASEILCYGTLVR